MIYSNERKLCLSGWLKEHSAKNYNTPLKLQKFLFFYETFSKTFGETPDFSHLRGYKRGPVFSNVWGDYTKERTAFDEAANDNYHHHKDIVNLDRAQKCAFIVGTMSENELSELTHQMNLWKSKEKQIMSGTYQVDLCEKDFNKNDAAIIQALDRMYPANLINNSEIVNLDNNFFVFKKQDIAKLTEVHFDILLTLTEQEELHNPVFVDIDQEGNLEID